MKALLNMQNLMQMIQISSSLLRRSKTYPQLRLVKSKISCKFTCKCHRNVQDADCTEHETPQASQQEHYECHVWPAFYAVFADHQIRRWVANKSQPAWRLQMVTTIFLRGIGGPAHVNIFILSPLKETDTHARGIFYMALEITWGLEVVNIAIEVEVKR